MPGLTDMLRLARCLVDAPGAVRWLQALRSERRPFRHHPMPSTPMTSDRSRVAFESLATVVMLVAWGAVAIVADGPLRASVPVPPASAASAAKPVVATASGAVKVAPS